jgi:adenylate kinase family enzyme
MPMSPPHHGRVKRVVILGRGGAGKSTLARDLSRRTGLPVAELDELFWQPGPTAPDPAWWAARQRELLQRETWIVDGDLGPYDRDLGLRLRAADTVIVLDFGFLRCTWRTRRRGREQAEYWRWVWSYRRRSLPVIRQAIATNAPGATMHLLRNPAAVRRFLAGLSPAVSSGR